MTENRLLILDFGSQVTQLIARRLRDQGVYCEIFPFHAEIERIKAFHPKGLVLSGGPASVHHADAPRPNREIFAMGLPLLGICYGQQLICAELGGRVESSDHREFGPAGLEIHASSPLFQGLWQVGDRPSVWMSHGDRITVLPKGFHAIATSEGAPFAAIADDERQIYGVQFHPEVVHTSGGTQLLRNFAEYISRCQPDWTMSSFRSSAVESIRTQVGAQQVICGLSGGVDSSVVAILLHEAIGEQLTCIFVEHGLLRQGEAEAVESLFRDHYNIPLVVRDAKSLFLGALEGVTDPEEKRKTIGRLFIEVFEEEARKIEGATFLAQGTLYPDVIESASMHGPSATIKSHHNVGGLPERMNLRLLEPVRELFKDEVRQLGRELGLPETMIRRHPFPGPGLAIRIPGEVTAEKLALLRKADAIFLDEIEKAGLYDAIWQAFAVLLPVRSVGVMGDARSYDWSCALRAVTSTDGMTADFYAFSPGFLSKVATRIVNEVPGINRVLYDVTSKPPGTIEWE